jgi:thermitase
MNRIFFLLIVLFVTAGLTKASPNPGNQLKIAVIDTGLDLNDPRFTPYLCERGHRDFTGEGITDTNSHGSHITGLIIKEARRGNYCLVIYKYYSDTDTGGQNLRNEINAIKAAVDEGVKMINISGGGPEMSEQEKFLIEGNPGVVFVVAAGNKSQNLDIHGNEFYPASYKLKNIIAVENINTDGSKAPTSNWGKNLAKEMGVSVKSTFPPSFCDGKLNCEGYDTGTSQATAIHTGKLIRKLLDATK